MKLILILSVNIAQRMLCHTFHMHVIMRYFTTSDLLYWGRVAEVFRFFSVELRKIGGTQYTEFHASNWKIVKNINWIENIERYWVKINRSSVYCCLRQAVAFQFGEPLYSSITRVSIISQRTDRQRHHTRVPTHLLHFFLMAQINIHSQIE